MPERESNQPAWRTSSYSMAEGGNCVEVAAWHKSSYSAADDGNCLEVAARRDASHNASIAVRDSKNPGGPELLLTTGQWAAFTYAVKLNH